MEWRAIPGFEGGYEASDTGLIRSLDRVIETVSRTGKPYMQRRPGRILKPGRNTTGHLHVVLVWNEIHTSRMIHQLILEAFRGPKPPGLMARHADDDPANNHISNLSWGTRSENSHDAVRNGRHWQVNKTHCKRGHPLSGDNLRITQRGHRSCKECGLIAGRKYLQRKRAS